CLALLVQAPVQAAWLDSAQIRSVDRVFRAYGPETPGCALGVFHNGAISYARGYGMADLERGVRITSDSLFDVGSVSKQFSAAAILLLADRGKLSLNDDVRKFIPEMPRYGAPITLNELMWHTSGLRDYTDLLELQGYGLEQRTTDDEALAAIVRQRGLEFPSGTQYEYSNTNYFLLSAIVKRVTGKTLALFVRDNVFTPLHMAHTMYRTDYAMLIPNRAMGYAPSGGQYRNSMSNWEQTGDGGVQLSVNDAFRWDRNFYDPIVGGPRLIAQMETPGRLSNGTRLQYARGLFVGSYRGLRTVEHDGAWIGYRAAFERYPSVRTSVVVLCNSDDSHPSALARNVADIVLQPYLRAGAAGTRSDLGAHPIPPRYLTGSYFDSAGGDVYAIASKGDGIVLQLGETLYPLRPLSRTAFQVGSTTVRFSIGRDGFANALSLEAAGESTPAQRFTPWKPRPAELAGAAGEYTSADLGVTWRFSEEGSTLTLQPSRNLPDGAAGALTPLMRDTFSDGAGGFTIRFDRAAGGRIGGITLSAGRGLRSLRFTRR
ncbi:MAG TPA: serine hydrolase domain-containing protein, partial [Candidatus Baltobacteraceae bacterium]|nr:serine hydrolase domain-containing protein [Candidatus Baltobacteraceae bacterium]